MSVSSALRSAGADNEQSTRSVRRPAAPPAYAAVLDVTANVSRSPPTVARTPAATSSQVLAAYRVSPSDSMMPAARTVGISASSIA